jgi:hypothetical protein
MELTKEMFEQAINGLATKADVEKLATKAELHDLETRLTAHIDASQTQLAAMTKRGFDDITARLDLRSNVAELERQMQEVRLELNLG